MVQYSEITFRLEKEKIQRLQDIVNKLHQSDSLSSNNIQEFIDFTLFIVFEEYKNNPNSLFKFYKISLEKYLEQKKMVD